MQIYINEHCKKVKGSHILEIKCGVCKSFIATYRKVGESNLVKMYSERIIKSVIDLNDDPGAIFCPVCNNQIATKYTVKRNKKTAYRLVPSAFNKKKKTKKDSRGDELNSYFDNSESVQGETIFFCIYLAVKGDY